MIMQCENCGEMFDDAEESHEVCPHSVHVAPERTDEVIFDPRSEGRTERERTNAGALLQQWN